MTEAIHKRIQQFEQHYKNSSHELKSRLILEQYKNLTELLKLHAAEINQDEKLLEGELFEEDLMALLLGLERKICDFPSKSLEDIFFKLRIWKMLSVDGLPKDELDSSDYIVLASIRDCEALIKTMA